MKEYTLQKVEICTGTRKVLIFAQFFIQFQITDSLRN